MIRMLSIAVCDDNIIECSALSRRIRAIMEKRRQPCILRQFGSGQELLAAGERFDLVFLDIRYFEIQGRMVTVHGAEENFTYYGQIGTLEQRLADCGFCRCHKSYLINLRFVESYDRQEIILEGGERIPIAKRRYEAFGRAMLDYMQRNGGIV